METVFINIRSSMLESGCMNRPVSWSGSKASADAELLNNKRITSHPFYFEWVNEQDPINDGRGNASKETSSCLSVVPTDTIRCSR
jgi:hypothetical protein